MESTAQIAHFSGELRDTFSGIGGCDEPGPSFWRERATPALAFMSRARKLLFCHPTYDNKSDDNNKIDDRLKNSIQRKGGSYGSFFWLFAMYRTL
jgi:hypothetical protein